MTKTAIVLASILFASTARATDADCRGTLHKDREGVWIALPIEGRCAIIKSQESAVLKWCKVGHWCRITGVGRECKYNPECTEVTEVIGAGTGHHE